MKFRNNYHANVEHIKSQMSKFQMGAIENEVSVVSGLGSTTNRALLATWEGGPYAAIRVMAGVINSWKSVLLNTPNFIHFFRREKAVERFLMAPQFSFYLRIKNGYIVHLKVPF